MSLISLYCLASPILVSASVYAHMATVTKRIGNEWFIIIVHKNLRVTCHYLI
jgi:hypothetical protein